MSDPSPPTPLNREIRILLVDDEPAIRDILAVILQRERFKVEVAADGLDAWEKLQPDLNRVDIVVTDNQMPRLDGVGLIRSLRAANFNGKIVVFSSSLTEERAAHLTDLAVDAIVEKGQNATEILAEIRRVAAEI